MAMWLLGLLYNNGQGVAQDFGKARELFEKAAAKGDAMAMWLLGLLYDKGQGVVQDYAKAREWYEKAAAKGDKEATSRLERMALSEAAGAGRYAEALQLQEALTTKQEDAETKREGKPGDETAEALISVAWYALLARDFTKALGVAERAHTLFPANLTIETDRAYALMFVGRKKECTALYLAYKGKPMSASDSRLWESVIAKDFADLRKAGLKHPMMADIEKKLGVAR